MVRCCSVCESEFSFYHSCLARKIANIYLTSAANCQLFICADEPNDFTGQCTPTSAPVTTPDPCETQKTEYEVCATEDDTCFGCLHSDVKLIKAQGETRTCEEINRGVFCPLESCCPACNAELDAVTTCVNTDLETQPDNICPSRKCAPTLPPTSMPTGAPAPGASIPAAAQTAESNATRKSSFIW
eukprot:CAMPEP_0198143274 /NCGR_PEP_ID=MMETSP1443-20131203/6258_1 /TAXON_ID=186043 /ORGANISM="Entomoneis sp., Strain CCMP2396" /LENGTH=185 /DNA_ID=CAMNT_0043806491 /DNA_START=404 /DNA_END=958 /DNA_ORIENTATION=+